MGGILTVDNTIAVPIGFISRLGRTQETHELPMVRKMEGVLQAILDQISAADIPLQLYTVTAPLVISDAAGGVFAVKNPMGAAAFILGVDIDITTAASGETLDVGVAANATTSDDTLLDGADLTATNDLNNISDQGGNGARVRKMTSSQWVTASASGSPTNLVGSVVLTFVLA